MKQLILSIAALLGVVAPIVALAEQPPLIDRNLFFGEIAIAGAQISPDGRFISFLKPYKGTRNIWVKRADEPFSSARPVSAEATRPIRSYFWSHDSKYILYSQDSGGDENFNIYAIDRPWRRTLKPAFRRLVRSPTSRACAHKSSPCLSLSRTFCTSV